MYGISSLLQQRYTYSTIVLAGTIRSGSSTCRLLSMARRMRLPDLCALGVASWLSVSSLPRHTGAPCRRQMPSGFSACACSSSSSTSRETSICFVWDGYVLATGQWNADRHLLLRKNVACTRSRGCVQVFPPHHVVIMHELLLCISLHT